MIDGNVAFQNCFGFSDNEKSLKQRETLNY